MWCGVRRDYLRLAEPYRSLVLCLLDGLLGVFGGDLVSLVVYGSVARGEARRDSDVDLLIIVEDLPRSRFERLRIYMEAEERLDPLLDLLMERGYAVSFSPVLKSRREAESISPLYLDMVEDAVIVYDKGGFFENVLERLRRRLEELGAERVWIGRKWYWRLKKDYRFGEVIVIE